MAKNLVIELVALFQGQKLEVVEEAMKEATKQVWPELVTGSLSELFDMQMETLKARGCPKSIIDVLTAKKSEVIANATEIETADGHIPFVPVVPRTEVDLGDLMKMVRNRDREGHNYLDQSDVSNVVDVPKGPYFMFDVEDGKDMLGRSPEKAEVLIKKQKRTCLAADEGIALCVHTNVLSEHYVNCTGSRYARAHDVPVVYLHDDGPELDWCSVGYSDDEGGSASCRSRA
ncbi:MAG: DUF5701 family protein [Patescibacteria group bacterium]